MRSRRYSRGSSSGSTRCGTSTRCGRGSPRPRELRRRHAPPRRSRGPVDEVPERPTKGSRSRRGPDRARSARPALRRLPRDPRPVLLPGRELPHDPAELECPRATIASRIARCLSRMRDVLEAAVRAREENRGPRRRVDRWEEMMTPEERIAEAAARPPRAPTGLGRGGEAAPGRAPRARHDPRARRAGRAPPQRAVDRPRGDASRRRRRADPRRRRPPAPPPRVVSAAADRADAREPADREAPRRARPGRRGARRRIRRRARDDDGVRPRAARRTCLRATGRRPRVSPPRRPRSAIAPRARRRRPSRVRRGARAAARTPSATPRWAGRCAALRRSRSGSPRPPPTSRRSPRSPRATGSRPCAPTPGRPRPSPRPPASRRRRLVHVNLATQPDDELSTRGASSRPGGNGGARGRALAST